jgi:beta-lactamase regulating signal transducer with metallopeptidase domain
VIFAARGLIVSLAFFAVLYSLLSLLAVLAWSAMDRVGGRLFWSSPNFLFGLRLFPFAASLVVTFVFTFPSFWLLERTSPDEDFETFVLAFCAVVMLGAGLFRVLRAQARTTRAVNRWALQANGEAGMTACATNISSGAPPLLLVGVFNPKVLISDTAAAVLCESELEVAVRHELGHKRSWDNLRKVLVSSTPFLGMRSLEHAWLDAAELAADDAAVTNRHEALDLAAALIKLSRSCSERPDPLLATALVSGSSSIGVRVERLLEWRVATRRLQCTWPWTLLALLTMAAGIASNYAASLALTHRLTELLVP